MISALLLSASLLTNFYDVKIVKVNDGDTVTVEIPRMPAVFKTIGVRIIGIDTAEIHDKRACVRNQGLLAKAAMENLVDGNKVDLLFCARDKYFRLLCNLQVNDKIDASEYMLTRKMAVPYWGERKKVFTCPR